MGAKRRELLVVIATVAISWLLLLMATTWWQNSRKHGNLGREPELIHYPGTESIEEQTSPNLGWRKYWFKFDQEYPSRLVFDFYHKELTTRGWRLLGNQEPQWVASESEEEQNDLFHATWFSPDNLFQLDLDLVSRVELIRQDKTIVSEQRDPGIMVYVTLRRVPFPIITFPKGAKSRRGQIETK